MQKPAYDVKEIEKHLAQYIADLRAPAVLKDAMHYSLQAGGKRIRPLLLLSTVSALGKPAGRGMQTACAVEMLHTYSLIHDDLPAMDDDDLRRGKPTNHKVFGEAVAILAGDGLLTHSFGLIAEDPGLDDALKVKLIALLAKSAGPEGMVAGQVADMEGENKTLTHRGTTIYPCPQNRQTASFQRACRRDDWRRVNRAAGKIRAICRSSRPRFSNPG